MALSKKQQKVVDQLVRRVELCREFMNDWMLFNQILTRYPEPGINKAELETQFLKIKSKLARTHKVLRETLADDYNLDGNTMNIISGATSLEAIYSQSEVAVKKLQQEWHRAFIAINETLGSVDDKRARAEAGEKIFMAPVGGAMPVAGGEGMSKNVKTILILLVIMGLIAAFIIINPGGLADAWRQPLGL
ncbi:MAG: hypothetical protein KF886_26215 [Candidatus Hydrogenedentes bacterium]|nr:hypothetical protein [Candidatus Hydrogenedentota bacterium]